MKEAQKKDAFLPMSPPRGMRDHAPTEVLQRQHIKKILSDTFVKYGFLPLETSAMEQTKVLRGQYGEEAEKLIFFVLNSGDFLKEIRAHTLEERQKLIKDLEQCIQICETSADTGMLKDEDLKLREELYREKNISPLKEIAKRIELLKVLLKDEKEIQKLDRERREKIQELSVRDTWTSGLEHKIRELLGKLENYCTVRLSSEEFVSITDRALRYDLTVPLARYAAREGQRLTLPFKRYQIQPVWRADRPQKGRYREFYQCDADIIGSRGILCELDMLLLVHDAFLALGLKNYQLRINHRKLLSALAESIGEADKEQSLCLALDKLDKTDEASVQCDLTRRGFSEEATRKLWRILKLKGTVTDRLQQLEAELGDSASSAINDLRELLQLLERLSTPLLDCLCLDLCLARGLSYYTGIIFEVTHPGGSGSLLGGGRYDNLTRCFSAQKLPGVGLSFGLDRVYDLLVQRGIFFEEASSRPQLLIAHLGEATSVGSLKVMQQLRKRLRCEHYLAPEKLKKQFTYAEKKKIPYILFAGEEECKEKRYGLKNIKSGEQKSLSVEEITHLLDEPKS